MGQWEKKVAAINREARAQGIPLRRINSSIPPFLKKKLISVLIQSRVANIKSQFRIPKDKIKVFYTPIANLLNQDRQRGPPHSILQKFQNMDKPETKQGVNYNITIKTSKTEQSIRKELYKKDRKIKANLLKEGRGLSRREFLKLVLQATGAAAFSFAVPTLFAKKLNDYGSIVPGKHKITLLIQVNETANPSLFAPKYVETRKFNYKQLAHKQLDFVSQMAELYKTANSLDMKIIRVEHLAKPVANMNKHRAKLTQFYAISVETSENHAKVLYTLQREDWVKIGAIDSGYKIKPNYVPNDFLISHNDELYKCYDYSGQIPIMHYMYSLHLPEASDYLYNYIQKNNINREKTKLGIMDAEFFIDHEDLKDQILINEDEIPRNGIDDDGDGYIDNYRCYSENDDHWVANIRDVYPEAPLQLRFSDVALVHGTSVAAIAGAGWNNLLGGVGSSMGLSELVVFNAATGYKEDGGYKMWATTMLKGFTYLADMGCKVINASNQIRDEVVVDGSYEPFSENYLNYLYNFFVEFKNQGIVLVNSAGNKFGDDRLNIPSKLPTCIAVAATRARGPPEGYALGDKEMIPAVYTSSGRQFKIVDGKLVDGGRRAVFTIGEAIATANYNTKDPQKNGYENIAYGIENGSYIFDFLGTSAAAPNVSGVIAALLYIRPELAQDFKTVDKLQEIIMGIGIWAGASTERMHGAYMPGGPMNYGLPGSYGYQDENGVWRLNYPGAQFLRPDKLARIFTEIIDIDDPDPEILEQLRNMGNKEIE